MVGIPLGSSQCPICFSPLEVRDVTPCFVCGGWSTSLERPQDEVVFHRWRLPNGSLIVLCDGCELEEFMVPHGVGERLGLNKYRLPINSLQPLPGSVPGELSQDKYCPTCHLRLALLKLISNSERPILEP